MVNCENPGEESISSSWDSVGEFSQPKIGEFSQPKIGEFSQPKIGKLKIPSDLESKLENILSNKVSSCTQHNTVKTNKTNNNTIPPPPLIPPPPPILSLNSLTNQRPRTRSLDIEDTMTSISNVSSQRRRSTIIVKRPRRKSVDSEPLPRTSQVLDDIKHKQRIKISNEETSNNLKISINRHSLQYMSIGASFIIGYMFCFYLGKNC